MRRAVREVHMKMADLVPCKQLPEVGRVSGPGSGLDPRAILLFVRRDECLRPSIFRASFIFPKPENWRWRGVMNRRLQSAGVRVSNTRQRRMNGTDEQGESQPFEGEHLRVAKSLLVDGIT